MLKNELKNLFTSHWAYVAVSAACELGIFDLISDNQPTPDELKITLNAEGSGIDHLLNFLEEEGFIMSSKSYLELTEKSIYLTENHPERLKYSAMLWSRLHLDALQELKTSVLTGKSFFEHHYGKSYFEKINEGQEEFKIYHFAMDEYARDDYKNIAKKIDLDGIETVADVGGGSGRLISYLQKEYDNKQYFLLDRPEVLELFENNSLTKCPGNFFEAIPIKVDAAILSRVLHDWSAEDALKIIRNTCDCLTNGGRLFIIENCEDLSKKTHSLLNLNMLVMCNSHENTSNYYKQLAEACGLIYRSISQLNELQFILQFTKS